MEQYYCSVREIIEDIGQVGKSEAEILKKIGAASQDILRSIGQFLPILETRYFEGECDEGEISIPPLLSVSQISNYGQLLESGDYILEPGQRHWINGPFSEIELAPLGRVGSWSTLEKSVAVTGKWGMYDEAISCQLSAVSQSDSATTITVSDGSQLSAGMVLLIDDEWEVVTGTGAGTDTGEVLNSAADVTLEELELTDGTAVKAGEMLRIDYERMLVIEVQEDTALVMRGWDGSKRAAHAGGASVYVYRTFNVKRGVNGSTAAAHSDAEVLRQVAPMDVNYLCRQMAALMINKSKTGYVGRAGNDELGTGFFVNEFPRNQIEKVKGNYPWFGR